MKLTSAAIEAAAQSQRTEWPDIPRIQHECEAWQIQVDADGTRRYCAACGKTHARQA